MTENNGQHSPSNILVTGGCGFIGSNFINYLFRTQRWPLANVVNVDKLILNSDCTHVDADVRRSDRYKLVLADLANSQVLNKVLEENEVKTGFEATTVQMP
jgi:dTDP-D-glucose 4,6-dehydratase